MAYKQIKFCSILMLGLGLTGLQAQESIVATGGTASGNGGAVSYSLGQMVYTSHTGTNGYVAQGVQQPFEISIVFGVEDEAGINLSFTAYPNPISDYLILSIDDFDISYLSYELYDLKGNFLRNEKITSNQTNIVTGNLVSATYFVTIFRGNKKLKTFKIIKR